LAFRQTSLSALFEPFVQADDENKWIQKTRRYGTYGTGLGPDTILFEASLLVEMRAPNRSSRANEVGKMAPYLTPAIVFTEPP